MRTSPLTVLFLMRSPECRLGGSQDNASCRTPRIGTPRLNSVTRAVGAVVEEPGSNFESNRNN